MHLEAEPLVLYLDGRGLDNAAHLLSQRPRTWAYVGADFGRARLVARRLQGLGRAVRAGALNDTAAELRDTYIDYIGALSERYHSLRWWESRLSEKQPYISVFFQNLCLWRRCRELLAKHPDLLLLVDNPAVYRLAARLTGRESSASALGHGLRMVPTIARKRAYFILNQWRKIVTARYLLRGYYRKHARVLRERPLTLIHTWVDRRSFPAEDGFRDSYFGDLALAAKDSGASVAIVPYILSTINYAEAIQSIRDADGLFLVPHYFMSWFEPLSLAGANLARVPWRELPLFDGDDVSDLAAEDLAADRLNTRICHDRFYFHLSQKLKHARMSVERVIYLFENQAWEKVMLLGLRRTYPEARAVGYQHSSFGSLTLNFFIAAAERELVPQPDKLLTAGPRPAEVLRRTFGPPVAVAGAIRYRHLFARLTERVSPARDVLVATSIDPGEAAELLSKCVEALGGGDFRVLIKCHPALPFERLAELLADDRLPANFEVTDAPPAELLPHIGVLVYTATTVALEALASNIPALRVESDHRVTVDPLVEYADVVSRTSTASDLGRQVNELLSNQGASTPAKRAAGHRLIESLFIQPSAETLARFFDSAP